MSSLFSFYNITYKNINNFKFIYVIIIEIIMPINTLLPSFDSRIIPQAVIIFNNGWTL